MTCRDVTEFLTDYLDGALPADQRERFEYHLSRCENCRTFLAQFEATIRAGALVFPEDDDATRHIPDELVAGIMATLCA